MSEPANYAKRLVKGSTIIFTALLITGFIGLFVRAFLARVLIFEDVAYGVTPGSFYGVFEGALSIIAVFELFRGFGLDTALIRHIPEYSVKKQFSKIKSSVTFVISVQLIVGILIAVGFFIFSNNIASIIIKTSGVPITAAITIIQILAVWFILSAFLTFAKIFQGLQNMSLYSIIRYVENMSLLFLALVLVSGLGLGVAGAAYAYLITAIATGVLSFAILRRKYPHLFKIHAPIDSNLSKKTMRFASPIFLSGIVGLVIGYMGTLMVIAFRPPAEIGYYLIALPMSNFLISIVGSVMFVFFPMVAEIWAKREKKILGNMMHFLTKFSFILVTPAVLLLVAFPDIVIRVLFGQEYLPAATALQIFGIATVPWVIIRILGLSIIGIGKPGTEAKVTATMAAFIFFANLLLISLYGIEGAAVAVLGTYSLGAMLFFAQIRKHVKFSVPVVPLIKTASGGALMLLFIFGLKRVLVLFTLYEALLVGILSLILYVVWILATKAVTKDDLKVIPRVIPLPKWLVRLASKLVRS